nr:unnamed protein product [Leishmania braziliensis]
MPQEPSTTPPASAEQHEASHSRSRSESSLSSNISTPYESALRLGPTLWVEMWENQRWYPVIGWGTSRFLTDLPNFCFVPPAYRLCGAHPADFDAAFQSANPPSSHASNPQWPARRILTVALPSDYRWVGFWEIYKGHPHGTDTAGWRYGEQFVRSDSRGNADVANAALCKRVLSPFRRNHMPLCVVRRRLWRRRVALMGEEPPSSSDDLFLSDSEKNLQSYLSEKQEEMNMAERLKEEEFMAAQAGEPWSQEREMQAEEELRKFCRERRSLESASRMLSANPSFANPFHRSEDADGIFPADAHDADPTNVEAQLGRYSGAVAASSWAWDSRSNLAAPAVSSPMAVADDVTVGHNSTSQHDEYAFEASSANALSRVDGSDLMEQSTVEEFVASTAIGTGQWRTDGADAAAENMVGRFVSASPTDITDLTNDDQATGVSIDGMNDPSGANFRAIFSQFMDPSGDQKTL